MDRVQVQLSTRRDNLIVARLDLVGAEYRELRGLSQMLRSIEFTDVSYRREIEAVAARVGRRLDDKLAEWSPF